MLDNDTVTIGGAKLQRIVCVASIHLNNGHVVSPGDYGGYVQSEANLSHEGSCWVAESAKVYGKARVSEDAVVEGKSDVSSRARVYGKATIGGCSVLRGCCAVYGDAKLLDCILAGVASIGSRHYRGITSDDIYIKGGV